MNKTRRRYRKWFQELVSLWLMDNSYKTVEYKGNSSYDKELAYQMKYLGDVDSYYVDGEKLVDILSEEYHSFIF